MRVIANVGRLRSIMLTFEFAKAYFEGGLCLVSSGEDYVLAGTQIRVKAPGELLTKTGARMMAITLPDPNLGAFLTIPAAGGRFIEMLRSELHNNKLTLLLFTRMTTVASGINVKVIRSPGFMPRPSRISLGIVV